MNVYMVWWLVDAKSVVERLVDNRFDLCVSFTTLFKRSASRCIPRVYKIYLRFEELIIGRNKLNCHKTML